MTGDLSELERNRAVVRRLHDLLWVGESGREAIAQIVSPGCVTHKGGVTRPSSKSPLWERAFPDVRNELDMLIAEGDLVVRRWTNEGTHLGVFELSGFGAFAPTGRRVRWSGINIYRLRDGQIVENWPHIDFAGLIRQLAEPEDLGLAPRGRPSPGQPETS